MGAHALRIAPAHDAAQSGDDAVFTTTTPRLMLLARRDSAAGLICTLHDKVTRRRLGWISFGRALDDPGSIRIDFFIEARERGRGLMREAMRAAAGPAFARLKARIAYAQVRADGAAAIAVMRGIGLRRANRATAALLHFEKDLCGLL